MSALAFGIQLPVQSQSTLYAHLAAVTTRIRLLSHVAVVALRASATAPCAARRHGSSRT
ncbi:hypothetical protein [Streptomyces lavenduligriseus]|uniref:Uncharacterized protein n=1 Tax=Streptomyces lavenduligriseus TaxID=67315 RepID=A0ABT0NRI6_9ACTN|nr:hypothetical protein [Streptomyces lavenduligriseus]MCL3994062.1 hypothetical protein [Streptomyces lavenduligriseus]